MNAEHLNTSIVLCVSVVLFIDGKFISANKLMDLLVLVALAPLRQVSISETQRGDQGGLRTHDTVQFHPGMKQDTTFADEICQAPEMQLLQLTCLWSATIFSSLELRLLAMIVIMCLPFTCAARLGKPDRSGMAKTGRPLTTTDSESKEKVTARPAKGSPDFQLPREVNKYLNR